MRRTYQGMQVMVAALVLRVIGEVMLIVRWIRLRPGIVESGTQATLADVQAIDRLEAWGGAAVFMAYLLTLMTVIFVVLGHRLAGDRSALSFHSKSTWAAAICFVISVLLFAVGAVIAGQYNATGDTSLVVRVVWLRTGADLLYAAVPFLLVLELSRGWQRQLLAAGLALSAVGRAAYSLPDLLALEGSLTLADLGAFVSLPVAILGFALYTLVYAHLARETRYEICRT
jgi:hypothetical protein